MYDVNTMDRSKLLTRSIANDGTELCFRMIVKVHKRS